MQCDWMQWIPCSLVICILFECRGFHAAWLNAVYSMHYEEMEPYWMRGILCSMIEGSGFLQNTWMQWILCSMAKSIPHECSGFHAAWLNAVESMQRGPMHPDWMQCILCSVAKWIPIECSRFYAVWCSGFWLNASWCSVSQLNAVNSIERDWMQCIPCSLVKCIPIECSGFHAAW